METRGGVRREVEGGNGEPSALSLSCVCVCVLSFPPLQGLIIGSVTEEFLQTLKSCGKLCQEGEFEGCSIQHTVEPV